MRSDTASSSYRHRLHSRRSIAVKQPSGNEDEAVEDDGAGLVRAEPERGPAVVVVVVVLKGVFGGNTFTPWPRVAWWLPLLCDGLTAAHLPAAMAATASLIFCSGTTSPSAESKSSAYLRVCDQRTQRERANHRAQRGSTHTYIHTHKQYTNSTQSTQSTPKQPYVLLRWTWRVPVGCVRTFLSRGRPLRAWMPVKPGACRHRRTEPECTQTAWNTCAHTNAHTRTQTRTHACTHARTHARTHTTHAPHTRQHQTSH